MVEYIRKLFVSRKKKQQVFRAETARDTSIT